MRALGGLDTGDAGSGEHVALFRVAPAHDRKSLRRHHHAAFGDGLTFGCGLCRNVDHADFAAAAQMGELFCAPDHGRYRAGASATLRVRRARVAAATSLCRIRLSPTRNVEMPALASLARSSGAKMPLSPTTMRPAGIE